MNINPLIGTELPSILKELPKGGILDHVEKKATINRLETPIFLNQQTTNFQEIMLYAKIRLRLADRTIQGHMKNLRAMETHICPVDLREPSPENFIQHMDYREQIDHATTQLKHERAAFYMYLRCLGIDNTPFYYKPPSIESREAPIAYPNQVHAMIHQQYSNDRYIDALVRYIICHNHVIGWRPPSEPSVVKVSDVDLAHQTLTVTMPKLKNKRHMIDIGEIANQHDLPSLRNWIDHWRNKVENQYSQDFLYLTPAGKPFTSEGLRRFLYVHARAKIRTVFPEYYNYTSRHWCAIARLIRTKLESKKFDEYEVMEYLGHTKTDTTMTYIKRAKFYFEQTGFDWISHVLIDKSRKKGLSIKITPVDESRRPPDPLASTGEDCIDRNRFGWSVDSEDVSDLSLSFSFFVYDVSVTCLSDGVVGDGTRYSSLLATPSSVSLFIFSVTLFISGQQPFGSPHYHGCWFAGRRVTGLPWPLLAVPRSTSFEQESCAVKRTSRVFFTHFLSSCKIIPWSFSGVATRLVSDSQSDSGVVPSEQVKDVPSHLWCSNPGQVRALDLGGMVAEYFFCFPDLVIVSPSFLPCIGGD